MVVRHLNHAPARVRPEPVDEAHEGILCGGPFPFGTQDEGAGERRRRWIAEHDRLVSGLSDLVVERLTKLDPNRVAVIGNAAALRQPRNIRNLRTLAKQVRADYVLLGQLQSGESGLRFITHFIRLSDEAHLKANRLVMPGGGVAGLEGAVVEEFERAVRAHVLTPISN